jgi:hypothetical protein
MRGWFAVTVGPVSGHHAKLARRRLRTLRQARGWTIDELARRANMGPSTISRLETGRRRLAIDHVRLRLGSREVLVKAGQAASFNTVTGHSMTGHGGPAELLTILAPTTSRSRSLTTDHPADRRIEA